MLAKRQWEVQQVRNLCILAHVDHGKTTLSDSLLSSNGLISDRLAGRLRFLDSTEEEQLRGITMEASAISLQYDDYLINLIDSPGHVDFSADVSTAVRLTDGALVLVDVVEGVCAQTHAVLRQAWQEGIRPCLILNKMDRLIVELQFEPLEAYHHICRIIEQVNVIISSMIRVDILAKEESSAVDTDTFDDHENREKTLFFSPMSGNVLFASAFDGWAFGIGYFAQVFAKKFDLPVKKLRQGLWGQYYYIAKQKKIVRKPPTAHSLPMAVQFVFEPIWSVYSSVQMYPDAERTMNILKTLRIAKLIPPRDLEHKDRRIALQAVMKRWLPLSAAVLRMVVRVLPSPVEAMKSRLPKLWPLPLEEALPESNVHEAFDCMAKCNSIKHPDKVIAFVSKIVSVDVKLLSDYRSLILQEDETTTGEVLMAVCRVYSGVLTANNSLYVLGPKYSINDKSKSSSEVNVLPPHATIVSPGSLRLYMIMGREFVNLESVPAGNIVGVVGLKNHILKTGTISWTLNCPSLTGMPFQAKPIVRVAVEPADPRHFSQLKLGLQRLYRADPTVEVRIQESGEHVIVALGEMHLERCIKDLKERFAKIPIHVSEPIVGFQETIIDGLVTNIHKNPIFQSIFGSNTKLHNDNNNNFANVDGVIRNTTPDGFLNVHIRAVPIPQNISSFLSENAEFLKKVADDNNIMTGHDDIMLEKISIFKELLSNSDAEFWCNLDINSIWCCGPRFSGSNLLICQVPEYTSTTCSGLFPHHLKDDIKVNSNKSCNEERDNTLCKLENSFITGFQLAAAAGPLCEEPMCGVAFVIDNVELNTTLESVEVGVNLNDDNGSCELNLENNAEKESTMMLDKLNINSASPFGPLTGQIISLMKESCRQAFLCHPARLVEAVYLCSVQCQADQLGKLYSVLSKRRGSVVLEELSDGTSMFAIQAHLPVVESFGFVSDLLTNTSGAATSPQLVFDSFQIIDLDPFFQPSTEEEREVHGDVIVEQHNFVRKYIDAVRKRKGLASEEKVVVHAEKQRTLGRNK